MTRYIPLVKQSCTQWRKLEIMFTHRTQKLRNWVSRQDNGFLRCNSLLFTRGTRMLITLSFSMSPRSSPDLDGAGIVLSERK